MYVCMSVCAQWCLETRVIIKVIEKQSRVIIHEEEQSVNKFIYADWKFINCSKTMFGGTLTNDR